VFPKPYVGYVYGTRCSTKNLSSAAWETYAPTDELVSFQGIFTNHSTTIIVEYNTVIKLLSDSISCGICYLFFRLDLNLMVLHLNNFYLVRIPTMLCMFLRVHLLERHFDYIEYQHVPRFLNTLIYALANYVLGIYLQHL